MVSSPLFVYGTLRDPDILAAVLGHDLSKLDAAPATAAGYRVIVYHDRPYPALVFSAPDTATGLILSGLSQTDLARLDAFEGDEYRRATILATTGTTTRLVLAYLPTIAIAGQPDWSLQYWERHHKTAMLLDLTRLPTQDGHPGQANQ